MSAPISRASPGHFAGIHGRSKVGISQVRPTTLRRALPSRRGRPDAYAPNSMGTFGVAEPSHPPHGEASCAVVTMSIVEPSGTRLAVPIRVAAVPESHVYVHHLAHPNDFDGVIRLADPRPTAPIVVAGQWWPPRALSREWIEATHDEFDLMHVQFGFDALSAAELSGVIDELDRFGKPLVYTVHDLRNPHHPTPELHDEHLSVLISRAAALITLTRGAADTVRARWGREPVVLPHPHVVPLERMRPRARNDGTFVVGLHAKSVRASMDPLLVIDALVDIVGELADAKLRINIHHDVFDADGARHEPALARYLRSAHSRGALELAVHDCYTDDELWDYLAGLDVSVLPYRFGTHSGWLEACSDLGTTVVAPTCGFYAEQRRCLSYQLDEGTFDPASLRAAIGVAYRDRPVWQSTVADRIAERALIAEAHRAIYQSVLST